MPSFIRTYTADDAFFLHSLEMLGEGTRLMPSVVAI